MVPRKTKIEASREIAYISYTGMPLYVAWELQDQPGSNLRTLNGSYLENLIVWHLA